MNNFDINFKTKIKEVFKNTIDFLNRHDLEWWACGGTAIGAVRHQDMIPWDDDVDIYMPRTSYNKLLTLLNELKEETGYKCLSIQNDFGYNHAFAKIFDPNTTIWEQKLFPYVYGVWVDIFILDKYEFGTWKFSSDQKKYAKIFQNYQVLIADYSLANIVYAFLHCHFNAFRNMLLSKLATKKYKLRKYQEFVKHDISIQTDYGVNMVGYSEGVAAVFGMEWFSDYRTEKFGSFEIKLPVGNHQYLTHLYGDYMTPPPENKRYSGHSMVYVNLQEGLTMEEVRKRIKAGEKSTEYISNHGEMLNFTIFRRKYNTWN